MFGWMGKVLRVDLSSGHTNAELTPREMAHRYVGGRGFTARYVYDEVKPGTDAMGPGNKLIFAPGPACGTLVPSSQRWTVGAKSPITGFIGDANCGGSFGVGMKQAGYDVLIIEGKAERPVYLFIDGDTVELRDASHLWGKKTAETVRELKREAGDPDLHIVSIGPAGENLVKFATIQDDERTAGRTGMGTVMGSKNLKAITVRGKAGVKVADVRGVEKVSRQIHDNWRANERGIKALHDYGSGTETGLIYNKLGVLTTRNFREGVFPAYDGIPERLRRDFWLKHRSCFSCPVSCAHVFIVPGGPYAGTFGDGLYAPSYHYTARLGSDDVELMCKMTNLSDQYGVDECELAGVIGWLMECYEYGIITAADLGGIPLPWGEAEGTLQILDMIVYRKGIGDVLAEGVKRAAEIMGRGEQYAMHVKGLSLDARDPRGSKGWALGYAVASRGADHCRHIVPDFMSGRSPEMTWLRTEFPWFKGLDRLSEENKGKFYKWFEDVRAFQHALEVCLFGFESKDRVWTEVLADMFTSVTGVKMTPGDVIAMGERINNLERAFNMREGLTRKDDTLPARFLKEGMTEGESKGQVVDLDTMLDDYYDARGWDRTNGFPGEKKLEELGLGEVADELKNLGLLK